MQILINTEVEMAKFAQAIAQLLPTGLVYLSGDLGAGKTTFCRYLLQALGVSGSIKSPTYAIVEEYSVATQKIYHFDLYRLNDAYELEELGFRDYLLDPNALLLVEWPSKGGEVLPPADITIQLDVQDQKRVINLSYTDKVANQRAWHTLPYQQ